MTIIQVKGKKVVLALLHDGFVNANAKLCLDITKQYHYISKDKQPNRTQSFLQATPLKYQLQRFGKGKKLCHQATFPIIIHIQGSVLAIVQFLKFLTDFLTFWGGITLVNNKCIFPLPHSYPNKSS